MPFAFKKFFGTGKNSMNWRRQDSLNLWIEFDLRSWFIVSLFDFIYESRNDVKKMLKDIKNQGNYYYFKKILADRQIFCMTYQCSILPHNRYKKFF